MVWEDFKVECNG